jgi:flagellar hook protein FlgE
MTRAGSFVPDAQGRLVNSAGYYLVGYSYDNGVPSVVVNSYEGLETVTITSAALEATASTEATVFVEPAELVRGIVTGDLPSANLSTSEYTAKSSWVVYDSLGGEIMLDLYYTKTGTNTWELSVFDQAEASAGTGFPYSAGPLATETLTFDPTTGDLDAFSPTSITVNVPGGEALEIGLGNMTQLATDFLVSDIKVNGNAPATIDSIEISADGIVNAQFSDGSVQSLYRIGMASVASPDQLQALSGNLFQTTENSGEVKIGFANSGGNGKIVSGAVESANVDIAEELTDMIQAQRSYTANSKVFQTGSDLMDVLLNVVR